LRVLKAQEHAYRIKIEYETLDQNDPCPTFDLRIISKAFDDVAYENLRCHAKPLPPASLDVNSDDFVFSGSYAFPSDFVQKLSDGKHETIQYDMLLEWPTADPQAEYYLDIESQSDFLSGHVSFTLMYEDKNRALKLLGRSHPLPSGATTGSDKLIERLKLIDQEGDLADDIDLSGAVLRMTLPKESVRLLPELKERGYIGRDKSEVCFNF